MSPVASTSYLPPSPSTQGPKPPASPTELPGAAQSRARHAQVQPLLYARDSALTDVWQPFDVRGDKVLCSTKVLERARRLDPGCEVWRRASGSPFVDMEPTQFDCLQHLHRHGGYPAALTARQQVRLEDAFLAIGAPGHAYDLLHVEPRRQAVRAAQDPRAQVEATLRLSDQYYLAGRMLDATRATEGLYCAAASPLPQQQALVEVELNLSRSSNSEEASTGALLLGYRQMRTLRLDAIATALPHLSRSVALSPQAAPAHLLLFLGSVLSAPPSRADVAAAEHLQHGLARLATCVSAHPSLRNAEVTGDVAANLGLLQQQVDELWPPLTLLALAKLKHEGWPVDLQAAETKVSAAVRQAFATAAARAYGVFGYGESAAMAAVRRGDFAAALAAAEEALTASPEEGRCYDECGLVYLRCGDEMAAQVFFDRALELDGACEHARRYANERQQHRAA